MGSALGRGGVGDDHLDVLPGTEPLHGVVDQEEASSDSGDCQKGLLDLRSGGGFHGGKGVGDVRDLLVHDVSFQLDGSHYKVCFSRECSLSTVHACVNISGD